MTESFALPPDPGWNAMTDYPAAKPRSKTLDRVLSLVAAFIVVAIIIVARYLISLFSEPRDRAAANRCLPPIAKTLRIA